MRDSIKQRMRIQRDARTRSNLRTAAINRSTIAAMPDEKRLANLERMKSAIAALDETSATTKHRPKLGD